MSTLGSVSRPNDEAEALELRALDSQPWYRRMLGPTSLSWQVVIFGGALNFPQMVLTGGNLGARTVQPGEYPTIALISAATILVSFGYGYLGHLTAFRHRHVKPVSLATFIIFYALGGALYSLGIQVSDAVSGSPSGVPLVLRMIDAMLVSIAWGVGVSLILEGRDRFRRERTVLVEQLVAEKERAQAHSQSLAGHSEPLPPVIRAALDTHLEEVKQAAASARLSPASTAQMRKLAATIDQAADVAARRSSHRAWEEAVSTAISPRAGRTLRTALTSPRIWPAPMAVLVALGVPTVAVRNFGLWWGLPATIVLGVLVWLLLRLAASLRIKPWAGFLFAYVTTAILVSAFAIAPVPITAQVTGEIGSILIGLLGGFLLVSFVATLQRERQLVLQALESAVLNEEAERLTEARAVASVARRLHGPVQSTLRVCAAEIERAAAAGDNDVVDNAVNKALTALAMVDRSAELTQVNVADSVNELAESWKGFVEVTCDFADGLEDVAARPDLVEIVNEAISNAHRHGNADNVHVRLSTAGDGLRLTVTDNGSARDVGSPGLGTRILRNLARDFDLTVSPNGATLDLLLPGVPQSEVRPKPTIA